jgi:hypothetical protein
VPGALPIDISIDNPSAAPSHKSEQRSACFCYKPCNHIDFRTLFLTNSAMVGI